jgi:putative nucleotidyltransferase-like protein
MGVRIEHGLEGAPRAAQRGEQGCPRAVEPGDWIARVLAGAWRASFPPPGVPPHALDDITPLLLQMGGAALGWWRVRHSELSQSRAAFQLRQAYRLHTLQAALHERRIVRDIDRLQRAGVEPLLGKGWAVARLYPEPGLRPYGDIDLCVPPAQHAAARIALRGPGSPGSSVDLHSGLSRPRAGQAFSWLDDRSLDELYERSEPIPIGEVEVRVLGPEDHLRLLCLHMLSHGARRPLWLCDIGAALEARPADFDWDWFLNGDPRRTDWAIGALGLAHQVLGARLDDTPIAERAQRLPRWLVPTVLRQWGRGYRLHMPMARFLRHPTGLPSELRHHWPNGIEGTVGVRGRFNEWPRLPFQLGAGALRTAQFLLDLPRWRRKAA